MLNTSNTSSGGNWNVASAAKLLFGRARSLSTPNPLPMATPEPSGLRPPSPSPLSRQTQRPSLPWRADPIPMEENLPSNRLYPAAPSSSAPSLVLNSPQSSPRSSVDIPPNISPSLPIAGTVKTLCNRGTAVISIHLSEPVIYLTGFEPSEYTGRSPAMLRGSLIVKLLKPAKIKTITLGFKGRARTEWPEGIPPEKTEFYEEKELIAHTWPFFNAQFASSETSHGTDITRINSSQRWSVDSVLSLVSNDPPSARLILVRGSNLSLDGNAEAFGIPLRQSRSFPKEDKTPTQTRGYRNFAAGEYMYSFSLNSTNYSYNFELPLDSVLPESIECVRGSVRYELEATIERAGAFKSNIAGKTEVILVRNPSEQNVEIYEPIFINRTWCIHLFCSLTVTGRINYITKS
jgi:arrestin-related trafficking adapter 3/6